MSNKTYRKYKDKVYTADENFIENLNEFFLAVAVVDGKEGVVAQIDLNRFPPVEKPLMGASKNDLEAILKAAREASTHAGLKVKVLRFTRCDVIEEFNAGH